MIVDMNTNIFETQTFNKKGNKIKQEVRSVAFNCNLWSWANVRTMNYFVSIFRP